MKEQDSPKPKKPRVPSEDVLQPPPITKPEAIAIQALQEGTANADQQKRALDWIIIWAAATYDVPYRTERPHDTAFACGRAYVGNRIVHALKLKIGQMPEE